MSGQQVLGIDDFNPRPPCGGQPTNSTNYGGVTLNVYGAPGQDEHVLARIVMEEMQAAALRKGAVFA